VHGAAARKSRTQGSPADAAQGRGVHVGAAEAIAANPQGQHPNVKPLAGFKDTYRLRQGDWRAVYRLLFEENQMRVVVVDVRGSVYR
jgi:mRNA-degrading endonuclease RelE of RelBE toxin-antitoxin system